MPILHWLTRSADIEAASQVQYRVLEEVDSLHYGDKNSDNLLIQGDNLDALKALLPYYAGHVKCIYIDPPYNTGHAFEHYDDNVEHSQWLALMYPRLEILRDFLTSDGSIWISIDDDECHYLKVICDEVFGRNNFVASIIWEKKFSPQNDAKLLSDNHDFILCYAKNKDLVDIRKLRREDENNKNYKNPDNDSRGPWTSVDYTCNKSIEERPNLYYGITNPHTGEIIYPLKTAVWRYSQEAHLENERLGLVWWGSSGKNNKPRYKRFLSDIQGKGVVVKTIWRHDEVGNTQEAKKECTKLEPSSPFTTPKPERLLQRILEICTSLGDLVMDTFLGSGTTAAVAHKMGRRYIGVEMGEHCVTHCQPRLVKVVDGEQGGISKSQNWTGGGGFRFYRLGAPLFNEEGLISREVTFKNLSAHIWFSETYSPIATGRTDTSAILGVHDDVAYVVLHPESSSTEVLTSLVLRKLKDELELQGYSEVKKIVVYGESCRIGDDRLREQGVVFKQIPYDVKAR